MELIVTRSTRDRNRSSRKIFVSIIGVEGLLRQLNHKIEITPWHGLAPGIGPEQAQPANSQPSQSGLILLNELQNFVSTCNHRLGFFLVDHALEPVLYPTLRSALR